jgi:hypothetical protein
LISSGNICPLFRIFVVMILSDLLKTENAVGVEVMRVVEEGLHEFTETSNWNM